MVATEIAEPLKCYEQIDILTSRYGISDNESEYREIDNSNINDYENYAGTHTYATAVFEDSRERLD